MPRRGPEPGVGVLYLVDAPRSSRRSSRSPRFPEAERTRCSGSRESRRTRWDAGSCTARRPRSCRTDVEAEDGVRPGILEPDFAVHVVPIGAHLIDLDVIAVQFGRQAPHLELLRLPVELRDAPLKLQAQPQVLVFIEPQGEDARRRSWLQQWHLVFGDFPRARIELGRESVPRSWRTTPFLPSPRSRHAAASFSATSRTPCR